MLLSDLEAAQDEAARALGDFARGEARRVKSAAGIGRQLAIEVRNGDGAECTQHFRLRLSAYSEAALVGGLSRQRNKPFQRRHMPSSRFRPWSAEDDMLLIALTGIAGMTQREIAIHLEATVRCRLTLVRKDR
ncbi:DUF6894 family protein [Bradyrhizobium sp. USDA 4350]